MASLENKARTQVSTKNRDGLINSFLTTSWLLQAPTSPS
jgi:hypothetical protein